MATTPKTLAMGENSDTDLNQIYIGASGVNTSASVVSFTNKTDTAHQISIYMSFGGTDFLQKVMTLPGGSGKERIYYGFQRKVINGGQPLKIQSNSSAAFNYGVHGREVEIDGV